MWVCAVFRGILFRFYFGNIQAICLAFLLFVIFLKKSPAIEPNAILEKAIFGSLFLCALFRFVSIRLFLVSFVHFLVNFYVICGILLRQSFAWFSLFCILFSLFLVALLRFVSTQIQFHLRRPQFVCRLFKHETAIRRPYFHYFMWLDQATARTRTALSISIARSHQTTPSSIYTPLEIYIYGLRATAKFILSNIQVFEFASK